MSVKTIAKTFTAVILVLCVLVGHGGLALALESSAVFDNCTKCPCQSDGPSCCVDETDPSATPVSPAVPPAEQRVLQPAALESARTLVEFPPSALKERSRNGERAVDRPDDVPLFLRHCALLI